MKQYQYLEKPTWNNIGSVMGPMRELGQFINMNILTTAIFALCFLLLNSGIETRGVAAEQSLRPPAVPLVTFDPYLSIWSDADTLTERNTVHWTHRQHALASLIRIDGQSYRLMGAEPANVPGFPQVSLQVTTTRSIYEFEGDGVHVTLTFMTAALPHDLEVFSRPLSYLTWDLRSVDGALHTVSIYDSTSSQLVVNKNAEAVEWSRLKAGKLAALRVGTQAQPILGSAGDDHRINWGYVYAAASSAQGALGHRCKSGFARKLCPNRQPAGKG
jgi:hypothetical protein